MSVEDRVRACLRLAESSTFEGEREAARGRAEALCEKHGLDIDVISGARGAQLAADNFRYVDIMGSDELWNIVDEVIRRRTQGGSLW